MKRSGGILLSVSSLPSPYGIGSFGRAARAFADFLRAAGQTYWQLLPLGPTGYGNSPYQSFSTYAGNPYFIDLDLLVEDALLTHGEVAAYDWGADPRCVDYGKLYQGRYPLLALAKERGWARDATAIAAFVNENQRWLPDYALFMALKRHFNMRPWLEWPEEIRAHREDAVTHWQEALREDVERFLYIQFLFFRQWKSLKAYINGLGIRVVGDLPIYVAMDSADVWAEPAMFRLNSHGIPSEVSGVPPDYFSADGQLWGNPIYDYDAMERDGFGWWIRRVDGAARLFDVIRIDHFRGLADYWSVPYGEKTARNGKWVKGPGMKLIGALNGWFRDLSFIAEDLGCASPEVSRLLEASAWPGMKVLEFAFNVNEPSAYLPHRYHENCVCYTGTHDNATLAEWRDTGNPQELALAKKYFGLNDAEGFPFGVIRGGMSSVAKLFIAQMQDYLELGKGHRMNTPGLASGNWTWRMLPGEASAALAKKIAEMTRLYGR